MAAFALQFERIDAYRGFCEGRGCTPATVKRWQDVPAVPATAFKHIDFVADGEHPPEALFQTSGTTGDRRGVATPSRGRHLVTRLSIYRHSLIPPLRRHLLAGYDEARERMAFISLIPSPRVRIDSSLSFMVGAAADACARETHWLVDARGMLDDEAVKSVMKAAADGGRPVLLLATSLALLHFVERLEANPTPTLPAGSRIMETGGFKGSGREIARSELHARVERTVGVASDHVVGEYGMTELLSQLYEPMLSEGAGARGIYVAPPWLRVRALDPLTLEERPEGVEGVLAFFDLANAGSMCHVLTEDVGTVSGGSRVRLAGRALGAEPRGCSLAMDELMSAARGTS